MLSSSAKTLKIG